MTSFPPIEDSVVAITGASSGIGAATARLLGAQGAKVCLLARSADKLEAVAGEIKRSGGEALAVDCDVRDEAQVDGAVRAALERFGRVDALINSAGLSLNGEVDGYALADWRTVIDTNLTGTFLTCRAVVPAMKRQGGGQIVNISSGAGRNGIKNMAAYCAAKFGVIGFTESLGHEVRGHNIRAAVLLPGSVATDFSRVAQRGGGEPAGGEGREVGYAMTAEEVAGVIAAMLAQPAQAWMSEVVLRPLNLELRRTIP
jgi:NADP-dependent 3-hydroxy acid dehydrogenase YdfG